MSTLASSDGSPTIYFAVPTRRGSENAITNEFVIAPYTPRFVAGLRGAFKELERSHPSSAPVEYDATGEGVIFDNRSIPGAAFQPFEAFLQVDGPSMIEIRSLSRESEQSYQHFVFPSYEHMEAAANEAASARPEVAHLLILCSTPSGETALDSELFGRHARHVLAGALSAGGDLLALGARDPSTKARTLACFESIASVALEDLLSAAGQASRQYRRLPADTLTSPRPPSPA